MTDHPSQTTQITTYTDREMLELAAYKIYEMLQFGEFDPEPKKNFEEILARLKEHINAK